MCGIFGIIGNAPIAEAIYHGIIQLQHRGQDAAGIFTYDSISGKHALHKDKGLVTEVFNSDNLPLPNASWGIGHVRYATIGNGSVNDTQPLYVNNHQIVGMAHNGNVVNYVPARKQLEKQGAIFESDCDVEVILHLFAMTLPDGNCDFESICNAVQNVYQNVKGAYSVVAIVAGHGLVAFRDPNGIRPLLYGTRPDIEGHAFSSETNSMLALDFRNISDVNPGEVVFIDKEHQVHRKILANSKQASCSFEYDYFSKPNTILNNKEVYDVRSNLGKALAKHVKDEGIEADVVIPIPSTARAAAIALAQELNLPYEEGFVKQDYIGRTFIMPTQGVRQSALKRKLAAVSSVIKGKRVILVDDSVVRGTVSKRVITLAREAGAEKVYFASTYPPIQHACPYGIDFPNSDQLIALNRSVQEVSDEIKADGLIYNDVDDLQNSIGSDKICTACLTGCYPTGTAGMEELQNLRIKHLNELELSCKN